MYRVWRDWPGRVGLGLALLAHLVVGAFPAGAACGVVTYLACERLGGWGLNAQTLPVIAGTLGVVFFAAAGCRGYLYLLERCTRRDRARRPGAVVTLR
jgi:hypothetical protein